MMKKSSIITLSICIPILTMLTGLFVITENTVCTLSNPSISDHSHFLRESNESNPSFGTIPLTEISMLGSHDALSDDIHYWSTPNSSEDNMVNSLGLRLVAKGLMVRLAKAQQHNIYDQLVAGVRYIDARITYVDGEYYTSHGLISNTLEHNLSLILKFLHENPGEFVLFDINNYYPGTSTFQELVEYISTIKYEGKNLYDYVNYDEGITQFKNLNYNNITNNGNGAGVVLFSDQGNRTGLFNQLDISKVRSKWHNKSSNEEINILIREEATYSASLGEDYLRINQAQQTPSPKEVWSTFVNWSLLHAAKIHNTDLLNKPYINEVIDGMPIYMCDFVTSDYDNFNNRIIDLMLTRNKNL